MVGKFAKLFGVPELGNPAAAGIEDRKSLTHLGEKRVGLGPVFVGDGDRKLKPRIVESEPESTGGEVQIFADDVTAFRRFDRVGQQKPPGRLAQGLARKAPATPGARDLGDHGRFDQALHIDGDIVLSLADERGLAGHIEQYLVDHLAAAHRAGVDLDQMIDCRTAPHDLGRTLFDDPRDLGVRQVCPYRRDRRQSVHDVADGAEFDDKDPHRSL